MVKKKTSAKTTKKTTVKSKTTKKTAKSTTKKTTKVSTTPFWKVRVVKTKRFITYNQKELASILDLIKELDKMENHVFHHHVSFHNNDFANWIEDVHKNKQLAKDIRNANEKGETQLIMLRTIINSIK